MFLFAMILNVEKIATTIVQLRELVLIVKKKIKKKLFL